NRAVELGPVRFAGGKKRLEGRAQQARAVGIAGGDQGRRVLALAQADRKAVVAKRAQKGGEPCRDQTRDRIHLVARRWRATAHATFANRRLAPSRVMRALSSRVLSRHTIVS